MIKWEFIPKSFESGLDFYRAEKGDHRVTVTRIGENSYTVWWWCDASQTVKHSFTAADWDDAKAKAISVISNSISNHIKYWQKKQSNFNAWVMEEV